MPKRKLLIGVGVLLALLVTLLSPLFQEPTELQSSYSYIPSGHRAFFELGEEFRPDVKRWRRTPLALSRQEQASGKRLALLLLEPKDLLLSEGETYQAALLDWVRDGNDLLIAPRDHEATVITLFGVDVEASIPVDTDFDGLAILLEKAGFEGHISRPQGHMDSEISEPYLTHDGLSVQLTSVLEFSKMDEAFSVVLNATSEAGEETPLLVEAPLGAGRLVVALAPELFRNKAIRRGDNGYALLSTLANYGPGGLLIDEFYHGLPAIDGLRALLLTPPFLWVTLSFLLLSLLITWRSLVRSEPIAQPAPPARRSKREHIDAMGRFISSSHDDRWVAQRLLEGVAGEVKAILRLDPTTEQDTTLDFLRRSDKTLAERYRQLIAEAQTLTYTSARDSAAVTWGRRLHAFLRDLTGHREHRAMSSDSHVPKS